MTAAGPSAEPRCACSCSYSEPAAHLTYHEFSPRSSSDVYCLQPQAFRGQLAFLQSRSLLENVLLTFDDAHRSQIDCAAPILDDFACKGVFFATTDWVGTRPETATWADLQALVAAGHTVASHGHTHALLTHCSPNELVRELVTSRALLEDRLGVAVHAISMPGGRWNTSVIDACMDAGYTALYTSEPGRAPVEIRHGDRCLTLIGRLIVRRTTSPATLARYAAHEPFTALRLRAEYLLKAAAKRTLGDSAYQALWRRLLRAPVPLATAEMPAPSRTREL